MSPTEMFEEFDKEPIAAASLAQVHKAVTKDKKKVAVKVSIKSVTDKKKNGYYTVTRPFFYCKL